MEVDNNSSTFDWKAPQTFPLCLQTIQPVISKENGAFTTKRLATTLQSIHYLIISING